MRSFLVLFAAVAVFRANTRLWDESVPKNHTIPGLVVTQSAITRMEFLPLCTLNRTKLTDRELNFHAGALVIPDSSGFCRRRKRRREKEASLQAGADEQAPHLSPQNHYYLIKCD